MATRLTLRDSARIAADQDNSTFPTDAAYNDFINRAARVIWRRMLVAGWKPAKENHFITAATPSTYLITNPVSVVHTIYQVASAVSTVPISQPLIRLKPEDRFWLLLQPGSSGAIAYELMHGTVEDIVQAGEANEKMKVELFPTQTAGFYLVHYTPQFSGFTSDADIWIGPDGSDELIILMAAIEGSRKEDNVVHVRLLKDQLKERFDEVIDHIQATDSVGQQTVRDARFISRRVGDFDVQEADY